MDKEDVVVVVDYGKDVHALEDDTHSWWALQAGRRLSYV